MTDETPWTDDCVRWAEDFAHQEERRRRRRRLDKTMNGTSNDSTVHNEEDDDDEKEEDEDGEEEKAFLDPFKDPDPFETFDFTFGPNKQQKDDGEDGDHTTTIYISLRGYKEDADQVWQSTGVTLWRASEHLCHYLVNQPTEPPLLEGKRILELGAGLGLCGILAHFLAGKDGTVCLTDGDTDALTMLRENLKINTQPQQGGHVYGRQLIWGHDTSRTFLQRHCHGEPFDVLIASDIVYALVIVEPLWETVRLLLRRTGDAFFLMAYARREVPVTIDMVLEAANQAGFCYNLVDEDPKGIWIYKFWWKQ